jgi:hypothetical protein
MAKKRPPRRLRSFRRVPHQQRYNSTSIRRLLFDVICEHFSRNLAEAADRFRKLLAEHQTRRRFKPRGAGLTEWSLYRVTRDEKPITFSQLDAVSQHLSLPQSVMLLFTRVRSEIELAEGHNTQEALRVVTSVKAAVQRLEKILQSAGGEMPEVYKQLSHSEFEEVRQAYLSQYERLRTAFL